MREIKFRIWYKKGRKGGEMLEGISDILELLFSEGANYNIRENEAEVMQFTGLKDKNGKEIYELMEINGKYRVEYKAPSYVLTDISSGDIIGIDNSNLNQYEITREYSPIS